jgi:hypothetical protein
MGDVRLMPGKPLAQEWANIISHGSTGGMMFPQDIEKGLAPHPLPIPQRAIEIPEKHAHGWYPSSPFFLHSPTSVFG